MQLEDDLSQIQEMYAVSNERIVTKQAHTFARVYDDMVRYFLWFYKETLSAHWVFFLSFKGSSFRSSDGSVIMQMGYGTHIFYLACVHQYLSPNGNNLYGAEKAKWSAMVTNFDNEGESSIVLMDCVGRISKETIRSWSVRNFFRSSEIVRE